MLPWSDRPTITPMASPRKASGILKTDSNIPTSSVAHNVFLSNLAVKAIDKATKKVDDGPQIPGLEEPQQRLALIKSCAEASFLALKRQAAHQGYIPWDVADAATLDAMVAVDNQIEETVEKVVAQVSSGTLPLDESPYGPGGPSVTSPMHYTPPMSLNHRFTSGPAATARTGSHDMGRYTYMNKLGSGGFGKVYLVADKLLGRPYALKQIQLSEKATPREVEQVVAEVQALAQMSHGNVVRLYHAWAETQPHIGLFAESIDPSASSMYTGVDRFLGEELSDSAQSSQQLSRARNSASKSHTSSKVENDSSRNDDNKVGGGVETRSGAFAKDDEYTNIFAPRLPGIRHFEDEDVDEDGIVFTNNTDASSKSNFFEGTGDLVDPDSEQGMALVQYPKPFITDAEKSDGSPGKSSSLILSQTPRVLCYTMDYHPMNLEHFIFAYVREDEKTNLSQRFNRGVCPSHCGHLLPALDMLSAICDGLCHIHTRKFAHRDIKPANILISFHDAQPDNASFVDLSSCLECNVASDNRATFDNTTRYAVPHVTDFGTAVVIGCQKARASAGTRAYTSKDPTPTEKSDAYALGIIALEMFSCPATGSERARVRDSRTVQGEYSFKIKFTIQAGISSMTEKNVQTRWGMAEVKEWLSSLRNMGPQREGRGELLRRKTS